MKKKLPFLLLSVLVVVLALGLILVGCDSTTEAETVQKVSVPSEQEIYAQICWENDGFLVGPDNCVLPKEEGQCPECPEYPVAVDVAPPIEASASADCLTRAKDIGAPIGSPICNAPVSGAPAQRMESGDKIGFGTITFDAETRVWILEKFIVPSYANYSYDYTGREFNVLDAPFVVGSELNPVNGEMFTICWDVVSEGCVPPTLIEFFPTN